MSSTNERRIKRERERLTEKIHADFKEKIKGMNREQVLWELEKIRVKYGIEYTSNNPLNNITTEDVDVEIL
jgi:hypothetical protein